MQLSLSDWETLRGGCPGGSRTSYSPLWEMWLSRSQYILTITKRNTRWNETPGQAVQQVPTVFVWLQICGAQNKLDCQSVWTGSDYGSPQCLDWGKQRSNSRVNAPTLRLLTASEHPVAPDNLQRDIRPPWYHHECKSSLFLQPHAWQRMEIHVDRTSESTQSQTGGKQLGQKLYTHCEHCKY